MKHFLSLFAFFAILSAAPAHALIIRPSNFMVESNWQAQHNRQVEKDHATFVNSLSPSGSSSGVVTNFLWLIGVAFVVFLVVRMELKVPEVYHKRIFWGALVVVFALIAAKFAIEAFQREGARSAYEARVTADTQTRTAANEAYKTAFKVDAGPIGLLFSGDDPRFRAGDQSLERLKAVPGWHVSNGGWREPIKGVKIEVSTYSTLRCTQTGDLLLEELKVPKCLETLFPVGHPLSVGLESVRLYYCHTKTEETLLTGFSFSHQNRYHGRPLQIQQYEAAKARLVAAGIIAAPHLAVRKERQATLFDSPNDTDTVLAFKGEGITVIWSKQGTVEKDMCGNKSYLDFR